MAEIRPLPPTLPRRWEKKAEINLSKDNIDYDRFIEYMNILFKEIYIFENTLSGGTILDSDYLTNKLYVQNYLSSKGNDK